MHGLGRAIPRPIERQERVVIQELHGCQRVAALDLGHDALDDGPEGLGSARVHKLPPGRVTRDPLEAIARVQMARGPLPIQSEEGGRLAGEQGDGGHQSIGSCHVRRGRAMIRDGIKTRVHPAQECLGGERLPACGSNAGHRYPCQV